MASSHSKWAGTSGVKSPLTIETRQSSLLFSSKYDPEQHIDDGFTKFQHAKALEDSKVAAFVPYTMRHTALTRFGEAANHNIFAVAQIAGHSSLSTTKRYVHPGEEAINAVFTASQYLVGTKSGTPKKRPARRRVKKSR